MLDRAIEIIEQDRLTMYDISELSTILIKLSIEQGKFGELSAEQEHLYNIKKAELVVQGIQNGLPYNRAEVMALNIIEKKYGEYRINKEKSKKFASICSRLESRIKLEMHRNKIDMLSADASVEF